MKNAISLKSLAFLAVAAATILFSTAPKAEAGDWGQWEWFDSEDGVSVHMRKRSGDDYSHFHWAVENDNDRAASVRLVVIYRMRDGSLKRYTQGQAYLRPGQKNTWTPDTLPGGLFRTYPSSVELEVD